jgi:hypothetical protein
MRQAVAKMESTQLQSETQEQRVTEVLNSKSLADLSKIEEEGNNDQSSSMYMISKPVLQNEAPEVDFNFIGVKAPSKSH